MSPSVEFRDTSKVELDRELNQARIVTCRNYATEVAGTANDPAAVRIYRC